MKKITSLTEVDFSEMKVPMIVIYNNTKDYPGTYVARVWEASENAPTNCVLIGDNLNLLREDIHAAGFFTRYPRAAADDPVIVESWA